MEKEIIVQLHGNFEKSAQKDTETKLEFWFARDLQNLLGNSKWENFVKVIEKARTACKNAGFEVADHFADIRKMVSQYVLSSVSF
jgi:DNA-damage-inducible protein D